MIIGLTIDDMNYSTYQLREGLIYSPRAMCYG